MTEQVAVQTPTTPATPAAPAAPSQPRGPLSVAEAGAAIAAMRAGPEEPKEQETPDTGDEQPDTDIEQPESAAVETEPEAPASVEVSSLKDLADHLGIEPAELYHLAIPVTDADGNKSEVTLSEWKDAYQAKALLDAERRRASEERATAQAEHDRIAQMKQAFDQERHLFVQALEKEFMQQYDGVNWDELRTKDPGRYAALRQDYNERRAKMSATYQQVVAGLQNQSREQSLRMQAAQQETLTREAQALVKAWPAMASEESAKAEKAKLRDYLQSLGFSDADIGGVTDHRLVLLVRDAMQYRAEKAKTDQTLKRVVKIGKTVLKPGGREAPSDTQAKRIGGLISVAKRTGKADDAARAISAMRGKK